MKRIAMLLVTMLLAIASVFSTSAAAPTSNKKEVKTEVVFNLSEEDVTDYRFGFAERTVIEGNQTWDAPGKINDMEDVPTKAESMAITYDRATGYASSEDYAIFYKLRGTKSVTFKISVDSPLKCNEKANIDYTVTGEKGTGAANSAIGGSFWTSATIALDGDTGTASGSIPVTLKTNKVVNASQVGSYSSSVTLTIVPQA